MNPELSYLCWHRSVGLVPLRQESCLALLASSACRVAGSLWPVDKGLGGVRFSSPHSRLRFRVVVFGLQG